MKTKKRLLSILLTLAMLLGLMPGMSLTAYAAPTCPNPGCRSTNIESLGDEWECRDCGYIFGSPSDGDESDDHNYAQYKNTTTAIKFDDKNWCLIDYDDDTVTLLAKECVGASAFDPNGSSNTYSGSTVESFVNNWYSDNITSDAKAAVNGSGMFLLTSDQASALSSDVLKCSQADGAEMNFWWLCSPVANDEDCAVMGVYGEDGEDITECSVVWVFGVRPALKLDLSKVEFDSESKTFSLAVTNYDLWVGGIRVTGANAGDVFGDGKVSYDAENHTLTLNGATITESYEYEDTFYAAIYTDGGIDSLTINVTGDNTVTGRDGAYGSNGILVSGTLTFTGTGTLTATGGTAIEYGQSVGVYAYDGVTVNEGVTLTATGGTTTEGSSFGVFSWGTVTVGGTLTATGSTGDALGIYAPYASVIVNGTLTATGDLQSILGTVKNAIAGTGWTDAAGTEGETAIAVSAEGQDLSSYKKVVFPAAESEPVSYKDAAYDTATNTVTYTDATCDDYTAVAADTTAFEDGKWYVVNSNVTVNGSITVNGAANLILADGYTLTVTEGVAVTNPSSLTIFGQENGTGTLTATGGSDAAGIGGIYDKSGPITINGGTVNATGDDDGGAGIGASEGNSCGDITINGGTVNASASGSSDIYCIGDAGWGSNGDGTIAIHGGTVNVTVGEYTTGIGYRGNGTINITGGVVNVNKDKAWATGIKGNLNVSGGEVYAAGSCAVLGNANFTGGTFIAESIGNSSPAIQCPVSVASDLKVLLGSDEASAAEVEPSFIDYNSSEYWNANPKWIKIYPTPSVTWDADQTIETTQEISGGVTVGNDITVTVSSGVVLTVNGGINANDKTVTVKGPGTLIIHGATGSNGVDDDFSATDGEAGGDGFVGNIIVDGAAVTVTGGTGGIGGYDSTVGYAGGSGGNGVVGNVTVNSGSIEVTGGTGGNGRGGDDDSGNGGNGGIGVNGTVTVIGGSAALTGGTGGNGGYGYYNGENGGNGKAITGTITGAGVESDDGNTWSAVSGNTSEKQFLTVNTNAVPTPPHTHGDLTFTAWESTNSLPTEAGNYYLTGDVKLDNTWFAPNGTTNLCLDGHSIGCAEGMPIQPICVDGEGTTLKLYDKDDNSGTITGALSTAGGVDVRNGGTFHMYGGTVTGNTSTDHGGGVRVRNNATFYLYGGTIENNKTQNMGCYGGGVHVETDSSFYMSGGSIQNNTAFAAAGVYIGMNCAFYMSGGSITGNVAEMGADGGVAFTGDSSAKLVLSGDVTISDNLFKIDDDEANFHISQPSNLTLVSGMKIEVAGALTGEGKICIAPQQARGVFTNSTGTAKAADYIDKFATDSRMYRIKTEGDELRIDAPHLVIGGTFVYDDNAADVFGDGTVKFTPAAGENARARLTLNGYQYDGTEVSEREGIVYFDDVPLDIVLKGENKFKVDAAPGIMINAQANTVISSDGDGSLKVESAQGDAIYANGELTIESGTISATGGDRGIAANGIHFNGGKIAATGTGERGYGIYCQSLPWLPESSVTIGSGISSLVASGTLGAVYGNATNALEGFGWSNAEGTEGREAIAVTAEARSLEYKKVAFVSHTHGFIYSASGATITATCANADGGCTLTDNKATLTIAAPDNLTYDKSAKAAVITDANGIQGTAKVQYQTKSGDAYGAATETAPTNAGTYKASITVDGATASVEYTIAKADPTCTAPTGLTATYGQTLGDLTLTNPEGNTAGTWAWADSTQSVGNVVSPAATFKANFTPTDTTNYNAVENIDVTVTVGKAAPTATAPTASATYGQTLGDVTLTNPNGNTPGTWAWTIDTATSVGSAGSNTFTANFTPEDTANYNSVTNVNVTVTVAKADPTATAPTASATYGQTLGDVTLTNPVGNTPGTWAWTADTATSVGSAGSNTFTANFTPEDTANYNTVTNVNVTVTVSKATPAYTVPTGLTATYGDTLSSVTLPTGWAWTNSAQSVGNAGANTFTANFTPADTANYNTVSGVNVTVTVGKATPSYTVPTGLTATYGDLLSSVTLPTGWAWTNGTQSVGNAGANTFTANFTPTDTANYNTVSGVNVTVTVGKADPTATAPTASATYGQTLGDVTLTNPNGNTPGTWA
ncbi:MAG: hypothetical protein IKN53_03215, partial [Oscillibacter sp.]|nr:hypothetical protein [Oscillibacter sp.]